MGYLQYSPELNICIITTTDRSCKYHSDYYHLTIDSNFASITVPFVGTTLHFLTELEKVQWSCNFPIRKFI